MRGGDQLPWLDVVDCDDGVAADAEAPFELDEPESVDDVLTLVAVEPLVVLEATDVPACVDAAIAPVSASIPTTLAAPTARRERRAGWGRRRLRVRSAGAAGGAGDRFGRGLVSFGIGTPVGARPAHAGDLVLVPMIGPDPQTNLGTPWVLAPTSGAPRRDARVRW
ncbi:MAG TPA: hypothetical protein VFC99_06715 [Acidimicrobiia bacterium]|nr:hypothetical protein [Acidimicrobiia bacterium]